MKSAIKYLSMAAIAAFMSAGFSACTADEPFGQGEGELRLRMVLNSELTRAEANEQANQLAESCRIYISDSKGILHKFNGLGDVPSVLSLKSGHYTAQAFAGKRLAASFDEKYYEGEQEFDIQTGSTSVVLNCRIANVAVNVDAETIDPEKLLDYKFTVASSIGSLDFTADNISKERPGFFSMPDGETSLTYTVTGKNADGVAFTKTGVIENVENTHLYNLRVLYNDRVEDPEGGAFITITCDETAMEIESTIEIQGRPDMTGFEFNLDDQVRAGGKAFTDKRIRIRNFGELKSLVIEAVGEGDYLFNHEDGRQISKIDILSSYTAPENVQALRQAGIAWNGSFDDVKKITKGYLTFSADFLNALEVRDYEYNYQITATDEKGKWAVANLRIANSDAAIVYADPILLEPVNTAEDLFLVGTTTATISGKFTADNVVNPMIQYAVNGTENWLSMPIELTRATAKEFTVTLTGLTPGTTYKYRAAAEDFVQSAANGYDCFTTESVFQIPNAGMEEWSTWSVADAISQEFSQSPGKILIPDANGARSFWDTGNHGSATMSVTLTTQENSFIHSGSSAARLRSQFVGVGTLGKFAAGNIFAGYYCKTDGTDGVLRFGQPFNGSHPKALSVFVSYTPKTGVNKKGANNNYIAEGALDEGQIYIALTTEPVDIRTKNANKLFNPNDDCIVAYGQVTFKENYGSESEYKKLEIPFNYYSKAKITKPLYIVIVCTASKYGDYFSGGEGSIMYLDDFELVY